MKTETTKRQNDKDHITYCNKTKFTCCSCRFCVVSLSVIEIMNGKYCKLYNNHEEK